jgi:hypothetical protein
MPGPISFTQPEDVSRVVAASANSQPNVGDRFDIPQDGGDGPIAYVTVATGAVAYGKVQGTLVQAKVSAELAAGTIEAVTIERGCGGTQWVYIKANEAISRGQGVALDNSAGGKFEVLKATVSAEGVAGVAQWAIPSGSQGWVQTWGKGKILAGNGGVTAGLAFDLSATAGQFEDVAAAADSAVGRAITTAATGVLTDGFISCRV